MGLFRWGVLTQDKESINLVDRGAESGIESRTEEETQG